MTKKQLRNSISATALSVRQRYGLRYKDITFDENFSIVGVGDIFFAQGQSADEIISEVNNASEMTGLSEKTCLLEYLYSSGAIYKN